MKKLLILTLCVIMLLSLFACEPAKPGTSEDESKAQTSETSEETSETASEASEPDTRTALEKQKINWQQLKEYESEIKLWESSLNSRYDCTAVKCPQGNESQLKSETVKPITDLKTRAAKLDELLGVLAEAGLYGGEEYRVNIMDRAPVTGAEFHEKLNEGAYETFPASVGPDETIRYTLPSGRTLVVSGPDYYAVGIEANEVSDMSKMKKPNLLHEYGLADEDAKAVEDFLQKYLKIECGENATCEWFDTLSGKIGVTLEDSEAKSLLRDWSRRISGSDTADPYLFDYIVYFSDENKICSVTINNRILTADSDERGIVSADEAWDNALAGNYKWLGEASETQISGLTVLTYMVVTAVSGKTEVSSDKTVTTEEYTPYYEFLVEDSGKTYVLQTHAYAE